MVRVFAFPGTYDLALNAAQRFGFVQRKPLGVVDPYLLQDAVDPLVLDELGDGALAQFLTDGIDGLDHGPIHWVAVDVVDKATVNLQVIDLEMAELVE